MPRHIAQRLLFVAHHAQGFAPLVIGQFGPTAHDVFIKPADPTNRHGRAKTRPYRPVRRKTGWPPRRAAMTVEGNEDVAPQPSRLAFLLGGLA